MIKIVIAGLDNAGKSSLLLSVNRRFSHLPSLTPTKGSNRTRFDYFGRKIIGFDLGGQKAYREDYLARPELFFTETDLVFYVHNDPKIQKDLETLSSEFESLAKQHNLMISSCQTSIFDRQTIDAMFSIGFRLISSISGIIEKLLVTYFETTSARALALLDSENLILGRYATDDKEAEILVQTALVLQTLFNFHQKTGFEARESFELPYANGTFIMEKIKDVQDKSYFLWILTKDLENARKNLPFFKEDLFPIVGYFFTSNK
jgi:hypothetical protein